jgi:hypothetical protein
LCFPFSRLTQNIPARHCTDDCSEAGVYNPDRKPQVYCPVCMRWYHRACLEALQDLELDDDEKGAARLQQYFPGLSRRDAIDAAVEVEGSINDQQWEVMKSRISRGRGYGGVVGNGQAVLQAREMALGDPAARKLWCGTYPPDVQENDERDYECPTCKILL